MVDRYNARGRFKSGTVSTNATPGCSGGNNGDCKKLLERLREIDFSLVDTVLYLDAYPHSCEALEYYHKMKKERADLVKVLSESCNMPLTAFDNASNTVWSWTEAPWPWEYAAN